MYALIRRLIFRHGVQMLCRYSESRTRQSASVYTHIHGLCITSSRQTLRHYSEANAQTSRRRLWHDMLQYLGGQAATICACLCSLSRSPSLKDHRLHTP
jgi:hypothetical protein